jgi:hypothetical protein
MRNTRSSLALGAVLLGTAITATACGGSTEVVGSSRTAPASAPAITATSAPKSTATVAPSTTPQSPSSTTTSTTAVPASPAPPVSTGTITQLNADLGSLGQGLSQVNQDLNQAQGDQ